VELPFAANQFEFTRIRFILEFQDCFCFDSASVMRLRRELRQALKLESESGGDPSRFDRLLLPPLSPDPQARRKFQKPSPGFVLIPPVEAQTCDIGDEVGLEVVFWGTATQLVVDFLHALQMVGASGLCHGQGPFDIVAVQSADSGGCWQVVWALEDDLDDLAPLLIDLNWWLDNPVWDSQRMRLRFITPARLLHQGKPLFRPNFKSIFPFILRRVTSMTHAWQGMELRLDIERINLQAETLDILENKLCWQDWRTLTHHQGDQELGGIIGHLCLEGACLQDLSWILALGSLLNLGKGAAYGCGRYVLETY